MIADSNVWSELVKPRRDAGVVDFIHANFDGIFLSTLVVAEIEFGIANARAPARKDRLSAFLSDLIWRARDRTLSPGIDAAVVWGRLKARFRAEGTPIADMDLPIAAQAITAGMPLVTRNTSDMARTGAIIVNPWDS